MAIFVRSTDEWLRRRIRQIYWKQWKKVRTKFAALRKLGLDDKVAWKWANTSQVVLAYGKQLDTLDLADKWPTPRIGMDVPGGRLQVGSSLRLLITAHCGSARWVVWKGLRIKSPHPYPIPVLQNFGNADKSL